LIVRTLANRFDWTDCACSSLVVTGASDGIGREYAIQLARAGFNVLLAARNQAKLDTVIDDIGAVFFSPSLSISLISHSKNAVRGGV
jgi:17beta-estradiol 17-dehydrogenase / very-long-chain 3-oxoacyl-CoA reductase